MNSKQTFNQHQQMLKKSNGISGNGGKYEFILTHNDLMRAYFEKRKDLSYDLKMERKRDRILMNASALEKELTRICDNVIKNASKEISELITNDIQIEVNNQLGAIISGKPLKTSNNKSYTTALSNSIVGGLMSGLGGIINDMFNSDEY